MSDNHTSTTTTTSSSNTFWSNIEHIIRPQAIINRTQNQTTTTTTTTSNNIATSSTPLDTITLVERFTNRLNDLKSSEPMVSRLKTFEELIKLSELFSVNEKFINTLLENTRDLFRLDQTPTEQRRLAFEYLLQFYQKQSEKFETLLLKNHLLILILIDTSTLLTSNCLFLQLFDPILKNFKTEPKLSPVSPIITHCDDIKHRFILFTAITKNGSSCKHLDHKLAAECLSMFLKYSAGLTAESNKQVFDLFKNMIQNQFFHLLDDQLISQLTKYVLNFSYDIIKQTHHSNCLTKNQINEIKSCIDLCEKLCLNLVTIESVTFMIIVLCELIDLISQKSNDTQTIGKQIFECMNTLLYGTVGHASLYSFFTHIFPVHNKLQTHRLQQINGALIHVKQLFEDFKQSKTKNTFLIKELHLNCLVYLPTALKSCCSSEQQQTVLFENILSLTLELVHLATHRELFMCLLTHNSRKFLIEIIDQFSSQIKPDNSKLIQKYADLLNLLDKKDVFNYKTGNDRINSDDLILQKFKENFHDLVYKFPFITYLSESCISNCIEYYLHRKLVPSQGKHAIKGIHQLIEKYFSIKNSKNCQVRKNLIDAVIRKLFDYNRTEYNTFIDDVIEQALLPCIEQSINSDNRYYRSMDTDNNESLRMHADLIDMKYFVISKLVELAPLCHYENNALKTIDIFSQIISLEKISSIELLNLPYSVISSSNNTTPTIKSTAIISPTLNNSTNTSIQQANLNNQFYFNKLINSLIDLFERYHYNSSHCMTRCCSRIYSILLNILIDYYKSIGPSNTNSKFSLFSMAAESLASQQQQQHQQQQQQQHRGSISSNAPSEISHHHNNIKNFNYYAQIRRDIFDFLFRVRSDKDNRVHLLNRLERKKYTNSKYLVLIMKNEDDDDDLNAEYSSNCALDYGKFLNSIEECLEKESDWNILVKVLQELPLTLQYEMNLIKNSQFIQNIFKLFHKREINTIKNKPDTLTRPDYICKFYPLMASLIQYNQIVERSAQEMLLQTFATGISSNRSRFCLETLTIAISEMHETNARVCTDILVKLSQYSSSQNMAQPVLELLSTISDLKKLDSTLFGRKEFIAVSAIAIKYTDPLKFNPFIILLAHYVICIWFIKCKQDFRKNYASFTCKGLYQEVIVQLDRLNKSKKDSKSPSRQSSSDETKQRSMTINTVLNATNTANNNDNDLNKPLLPKTVLNETMKVFYRELVEITLDFMSNNMYFDNSQQIGFYGGNSERREFLVDIYSNASLASSSTSSALRNNSLIEGSTMNNSSQLASNISRPNVIQSKSWIVGNKIIQIKTGLFSNICVEEPNSNLSRKQRVNSTTNNNIKKTDSSSNKLVSSMAINIPNQVNNATNKVNESSNKCSFTLLNTAQASGGGHNDSFASSESSTNNSYTNNTAKNDLGDIIAQNRKSSLLSTGGGGGDDASLSAKSEQDYFEEAIESNDEKIVPLVDQSETVSKPTKSSVPSLVRRNNLLKRRYKSGIPLSNERSDDDLMDEIYLGQYSSEMASSKQSKDDSDSSADEMKPPADCLYHSDYAKHLENIDSHSSSQTYRNNSQSRSSANSQRNQNSKNYSDNYSNDSRRQTNNADETDGNTNNSNKMCQTTCWCNNLVEVTCRYPTKVVTYVALIDSNNCTSHELNLSLIELKQEQQRLIQSKSLVKINSKISELKQDSDTDTQTELTSSIIENAIEMRRKASLSRISESSVSHNELSSANSNNSLDLKDDSLEHQQLSLSNTKSSNTNTALTTTNPNHQHSVTLAKTAVLNQIAASHQTASNLLNKSFLENESIYQRPALMRKASFDSSNINIMSSLNKKQILLAANNNNNTANSTDQISSSPNNSFLQSGFIVSSSTAANTNLNNLPSRQVSTVSSSSSGNNATPSIDPSQCFLHLFQQNIQNHNETKDQQPMMIPDNPASQRSMNILDYLPCYLIHKIGVVYIGRNQANDEKAILSNASGSQRYKNFINGLGQLMRLKDLDTNRYYSGGLETDGSAGEFTLIWFDGIIQVVFHVATMMPLREDNYNSKKKHIGNDYTLIVYNESGEEYEFNMIKGEVNCVCIEIEPVNGSSTNLVRVKTTNELTQSSWIIHQEQKFVSDQNLAIVTRKIALHADIASRCFRFQKDNNGTNPYGGKWYERLKQINRIRKSCKEYYAKQQPVKSGGTPSTGSASSSSNSSSNQTSNSSNPTAATSQNNDIQFDFTEYI